MYSLSLLSCTIVLFGSITALRTHRNRRQINNAASVYQQRSAWLNAPSGSIPGTAYYKADSDPNYGSFISHVNRPNGANGIRPISYDPNSRYFITANQPANSLYNGNSGWSSANQNNYYNQPSNRYAPGSSGWYAGGGNLRYNGGRSVGPYCLSLIISMLIVTRC